MKTYKKPDNTYGGQFESNPPEGYTEVSSVAPHPTCVWTEDHWECVEGCEAFRTPEWEAFSNALMSSSLGQRIMAVYPVYACYAACVASMAAQNADALNMIIPICVTHYSITPEEKTIVNDLIDQYHVPLNRLT